VKEERKTLDQEIEWLRSLRDIEEQSFGRVSRSGIFRGIQASEWEAFGKESVNSGKVVVRHGFRAFIERIRRREDTWGIVSVNFCSHFIKSVVEQSSGEHFINIRANVPNGSGVLIYPDHSSLLATSDSKLEAMREIAWVLHKSLLNWDRVTNKASRTVYIGDSGTDIGCLTEEGIIGIVISGNGKSTLVETMRRVGREPIHISEYQEESNALYWALNFEEILNSSLFGLER